jgi:hypothetical protein
MATYADDRKQLAEVYNPDESLPDHIYWQLSVQGSCCQQSISGRWGKKKQNDTILMLITVTVELPLLLFSTYALQPSRLIVRSRLDVPTFTTRRLHVSSCESTQWRKVELWTKKCPRILPNMPTSNLHLGIFYVP